MAFVGKVDKKIRIFILSYMIVKHLKVSPVFYPGEEFTEKVYKDYFMSNDLELIGAYADGKLVGIIEWNQEENDFLEGKLNSVNVG